MIITANGKPVEISGEISVTKLLEEIKVEMPEYVSVQLDDRMLLRADFDTATVTEGAVVEFLYYMGGGQGITAGQLVTAGYFMDAGNFISAGRKSC
ncbi:MAG: sulfur carrier protein ThiS [Spirochaetaceae bacterium]|nr:sulfur carrier protein ThiS [Spirochaetaceae bacterium]